MKRVLAFLTLIFSLASGTARGAIPLPAAIPEIADGSPVKAAADALRNGQRGTAMALAKPQAEKGDADALFLVSYLMESGEPLRPSLVDALDFYYRKSAAAGHPEAQYRRWLIAIAAQKDKDTTLKEFESAAEKDGSPAARILGETWLRGFVDGKPNPERARELWEKAGNSGDAASFMLLAKLHEGAFGNQVTIDRKASLRFYREAAKLGYRDAYEPLGTLLLMGDDSIRNEDEGRKWMGEALGKKIHAAYQILGDYEEAIKKNKQAASESYHRGAEAGDTGCMLRIANQLLAGDSTKEKTEGAQWLKKAADAGDPQAAADLGRRLLPTDPQQGYHYLLAAGNDGIPQAQYDLGMMYLEGKQGKPDPVAAIPWFMEAMKSGDAQMQYQLGTLNEQGIGCSVNYANAGVLYTMACTKGHAKAAGRIAYLCSEGLGKKRSPALAWAYANLAIERGDDSVKNMLPSLDLELDAAGKALAESTLASLRNPTSTVPGAADKAKPKTAQ